MFEGYQCEIYLGVALFVRQTWWLVKRRSRVLRRRTPQAALDKPRVHDGQWGFYYTRALLSVTAENRPFEEKQPLVSRGFMDSWWSEDLRSANLELEAAVARGKSRYGSVTVRGLGVRTRKTNFRCPQFSSCRPRYTGNLYLRTYIQKSSTFFS